MNICSSFLLYLCFSILGSNLCATSKSDVFRDFKTAASALPTFRELYNQNKISLYPGSPIYHEFPRLNIVTLEGFEKVMDEFFALMSSELSDQNAWLGPIDPLQDLTDSSSNVFVPYAQKLWTQPGTHLLCKGDLHGDLHSLVAFIDSLQEKNITSSVDCLKISNPDYRLIFHGDYVDRGLWGVEVLYLLMLLKIKNPDQVYLIRGNHEDPQIAQQYGFATEFFAKFHHSEFANLSRCYNKLSKLYNYLPLVCYVGSGSEKKRNFLQLCHGGLELGYNPKQFLHAPQEKKYQWIQKFERCTHCHSLQDHSVKMPMAPKPVSLSSVCIDFVPQSPMFPYPIGFLWHDFVVDPSELSFYKPNRGFQFNKDVTEDFLRSVSTPDIKLFGIVRAHQHTPDNNDPMMKLLLESHGCAALWQKQKNTVEVKEGMVLTLLLSPDSLHGTPNLGGMNYTGFDYDTYAAVTTAEKLAEWTVKVVNKDIYSKAAAAA